MAQFQTQSIPREKFLLVAVNLLHRAFIEAARTDAKNVYRTITDGRAIHLTTVQMEDKSTARFSVALDHSEFQGRLNYGAFRASLVNLIGQLTQALREEKELTVFEAGDGDNTMIFGVTAVTVEDGKPNVMVLGAEPGDPGGDTVLRLLYLDPGQFADQQAVGAVDPGQADGE